MLAYILIVELYLYLLKSQLQFQSHNFCANIRKNESIFLPRVAFGLQHERRYLVYGISVRDHLFAWRTQPPRRGPTELPATAQDPAPGVETPDDDVRG
jgi:hypothetical protein